MRRHRTPVYLALLAILAGGACTNGQQTEPTATPPTATPKVTQVAVDVQEFAILPDSDTASAGDVTFSVENTGEETHEFVVARTDLDPGKLPTVEDGSVDEEKVDVAGEIEDIETEKGGEVTLDLTPGAYVLFCNIVETEDGETEAHYKLGMRTGLTVE